VQQLQNRPYYLFLYLDALIEKDTHLVSEFADLQVSILLSHSPGGLGYWVQVKLYAEFATSRLIDFLRASNDYNLEIVGQQEYFKKEPTDWFISDRPMECAMNAALYQRWFFY